MVWVEYAASAGGVWACEDCERRRRGSKADALLAVLAAAKANEHAGALRAEGVASVAALEACQNGALRCDRAAHPTPPHSPPHNNNTRILSPVIQQTR
jgi:hypothetical protein